MISTDLKSDVKQKIKELVAVSYKFSQKYLLKIEIQNKRQKTEAVARRCSVKRVFLGFSGDARENTCARVSFLIKFVKKETQARVFSSGFCEISENTFSVNDVFYSESDTNINFYSDISPLDTKYFNPNEIREGFECLCKNGFSVFHVNIRSINKTLRHLQTSVLN